MNIRLALLRFMVLALPWLAMWLPSAAPVTSADRSVYLEAPSFGFTIVDHIAPDGSIAPGNAITYTLLLTNTGAVPLVNVAIAVLAPRHTTTPAPGPAWQCEPAVSDPQETICRTAFATLAPGAVSATRFTLQVAAQFPANQNELLLQANVSADNVVCGDCGYACCITPVVHGGGGAEHRVLLPLLAAP